MSKFRDLKAGDGVFVVWQRPRNQTTPGRAGVSIVEKVGRKYAYIPHNEKFCLETGMSIHSKDSNTRSNGYGFDVYFTEDEFLKKKQESSEVSRLNDRLCDRWGKLKKLPTSTVEAIHHVLDEDGIE